jgi:hypothetical protein
MESSPSTPNLLLVLSLSFKKELKASTLESYLRMLIFLYLEKRCLGISSISFIR